MNKSGEALCRKEAIIGDATCAVGSTGLTSELKCHYEVAKKEAACMNKASKIDTARDQFVSASGVAAGGNHESAFNKEKNMPNTSRVGFEPSADASTFGLARKDVVLGSTNYSQFSSEDYLVGDIDAYIASMSK